MCRPICPTRARRNSRAQAADCIRRLLEITRGRAFVLFTSHAQMNEIYERLLGQLEFHMLKQGDAPKSALLEEFRLTPNAVLFGTSSFWQGVDVQGEQLSCVIIDRLPFAVPSDPVVAARVKAIDAAGGNAFYEYQVPSAVITLKQGFGRLIRSLHDRGLLALLDNRILKKQYGRVFVESLPHYTKTTEMRKVEEFFGLTRGTRTLLWSRGPFDSARLERAPLRISFKGTEADREDRQWFWARCRPVRVRDPEPHSYSAASFSTHHLQVGGDVLVQFDRDGKLADRFSEVRALDLAAVDVEALFLERIGDVADVTIRTANRFRPTCAGTSPRVRRTAWKALRPLISPWRSGARRRPSSAR